MGETAQQELQTHYLSDMDLTKGTGKSSSQFGANGMTATEYRSQFSMWCMFASPLTICNDVGFWTDDAWLTKSVTDAAKRKNIRDHKDFDLETLKNEEMIAIDQDRMGQPALLMETRDNGDIEVYMKDLENGDIALAVLNRGTITANVSLNLPNYYLTAGQQYYVRDLWAHDYVPTQADGFTTAVASHETKDEAALLPLRGAKGVHVVSTVCNGIATSAKVKL